MAGKTYETNIRIGGQVSKSLSNSVKAASGQLGGLTKSLKGIATAADELTRFAEDAAKMGVAFDLPADKAGEMAAVIRSSLGITQDDFVVLADKINYFGNTTTQSADKLIEVVQASGLIGKQAGVNADQIAAMGAAMNGMDAANMGTALANIYGSLMTGSGATKAAQEAWKSLGFTSAQVAKDMLEDSEGTMIKIFDAMQRLPKDQLASTTAAIFGNNKSTKMAIASFTENLDTYVIGKLKNFGNSIKNSLKIDEIYQNLKPKLPAIQESAKYFATNLVGGIEKFFKGDSLSSAFSESMSGVQGVLRQILGNEKGDMFFSGLQGGLDRVSTFVEVIKTNVGEVFAAFHESLRPVFDSLGPVISDIASAFGSLKTDELSILSTVFGGIKDVAKSAAPFIGSLITTIVDAAGKILPVVADISGAVLKVIEMIIPVLVGIFGEIMSNAGSVFDGIMGFVGAFVPVVSGVVDTIMMYLPGIMPVFQALGSTIGNLVKRIGQTLQILAPLFADIFDFICRNVIPVAAIVFENLGRVICTVVDVVANALPVVAKVLTAVWQWIEPVLQVIANAFQFAFGFISGTIAGAIDIIGGYLSNVLLAFNGVIDFVTGVFTGNWAQAWQGVQDIFKGVFGALESLVKMPMLAKGTDYFDGGMAIVGERGPELVNMSRGSQVVTNSKTQGLIDTIRQLFDVSPSLLSNQSALQYASELDSGGVGGTGIKVEVNPTVIIKGNADEKDVEKGVKSAIEKALPITMAQFEKMMKQYEQNKRRVSLA